MQLGDKEGKANPWDTLGQKRTDGRFRGALGTEDSGARLLCVRGAAGPWRPLGIAEGAPREPARTCPPQPWRIGGGRGVRGALDRSDPTGWTSVPETWVFFPTQFVSAPRGGKAQGES